MIPDEPIILLLLLSIIVNLVLLVILIRKRGLKNKSRQLEILLHRINDFIYIKDKKSRFIIANRKNAIVVGLDSEKQLIGKSDLDIYPPELANKFLKDEHWVIENKEPLVGIVEKGFNEHGKEASIYTSKYPIFNKMGKVIGIAGIGRDITELIKIKEELEQSNSKLEYANYTKERLISIIGHDLRNSLGHIIGYTGLLLAKKNRMTEEKKEKMLRIIGESTNNVKGLLENILNWSECQVNGFVPSPQHLPVADLIQKHFDAVDIETEAKDIKTIYNQPTDENIYINADKDMMDVILRNLIGNAIKYTPRDGYILIEANKKGAKTELTITNSGERMSAELFDNILKEKRVSLKKGIYGELGSGFGLKFVIEFILLNNGT